MMDARTEALVARLRDAAKNALTGANEPFAHDLREAANKIEELHKAAYFTIRLPRPFRRTR